MTYQLNDHLPTVLQQLGSTLLGVAKTQADKLSNEGDSEALHDFRVSVRRLRSFLKSYEDFVKSAKKHRQRFSDIMTLTNAGRDHEVQVAWLKIQQEKAGEVEQAGILYLLENLRVDEHVELDKVKKQFDRAVGKLAKTLSDNSPKPRADEPNFARITAKVLETYHNDFQALLRPIENAADDTAIHRARIAAKKLRYTLELLESKEATSLVKTLKKFQDVTGDLHDLQVLEPKVQTFLFAETVLWSQAFRDGSKTLSQSELSQLPELRRSYALAAVQRRLEAEKTALYKMLQRDWLGTAGREFFQHIGTLIKTLAPPKSEAAKKPKKVASKNKKPNAKNPPPNKAKPEKSLAKEAKSLA